VDDDELDRVFKALGDPTRRSIIDRLKKRSKQSLFEICSLSAAEGGAPLSRQAITQHLDLLERAGLIEVQWSGRTKLHSLNPGPLREAARVWLRKHL